LVIWGVFSAPTADAQWIPERIDERTGAVWYGTGGWSQSNTRLMLIHAWRKHLPLSGDRRLIEPLPVGPRRIRVGNGVRINPEWEAWRRRTQAHWGLVEHVTDSCDRFKVDRLLIEAKASGECRSLPTLLIAL
jgi:hypothetical protein